MGNQGDVAFVVDIDLKDPGSSFITSYSCLLPSCSEADVALCYLKACNTTVGNTTSPFVNDRDDEGLSRLTCTLFSTDEPLATFAAKKKYKPVARKVRPILSTLPSRFRIEWNIISDPLTGLPVLPTHPPPFAPRSRYTKEQRTKMDNLHPHGFLWPAERDLMHYFAWDDSEHGHFREDFFPPVEIPVVTHTPWVKRNIPIPPGIYDEVC